MRIISRTQGPGVRAMLRIRIITLYIYPTEFEPHPRVRCLYTVISLLSYEVGYYMVSPVRKRKFAIIV